ncbi:MAG: hypothetical protein MZV63_38550 [Marinilabiliales bacterium]|nr:hypothetical protein [Marinilabiliales bacterium]
MTIPREVVKGKKAGASTGMDKSRQELADTLPAGKSSKGGLDPMLPVEAYRAMAPVRRRLYHRDLRPLQ